MILKLYSPGITKGQSIQKVASGFYSVGQTVKIADLADSLAQMSQVMAVAVVDRDGHSLGIITRVNLFGLLGRAFGREVLGKKTVDQILEPARSFDTSDNLFFVSEKLHEGLDKALITYYLLRGNSGRFEGIFSSQDLLLYISHVVQTDIELAGHLQDRLMRGGLDRDLEGAQIKGFSLYAKGVGGDFYQVQKIGKTQWFLTLCDVSGKGVAASFITALLWGLIRMYDFSQGMKNLIKKLNESIIESFQLEKYFTGFFINFDTASGRLVWADMGHSHAYLRRGDRVRPLRGEKMNLPVGLDLNLDPFLYQTVLKPGEELLVFTDGLVEQLDAQGQEYGEQRLLTHFQAGGDFMEALIHDFTRFKNDLALHDDTTVLHMVYQGSPVRAFRKTFHNPLASPGISV